VFWKKGGSTYVTGQLNQSIAYFTGVKLHKFSNSLWAARLFPSPVSFTFSLFSISF